MNKKRQNTKPLCINPNCEEKPRYGSVNINTGMFEKKYCKLHKTKNTKGNAPSWCERYCGFIKIAENREYKLISTKEEWEDGTRNDGVRFKPKMRCPNNHIVNNTAIGHFVNDIGCSICSGNEPWNNRFNEFNEECIERNYTLITTKEEWVKGTNELGHKFKPKMKCNKGHIVDNTRIHNFVNSNNRCPKCINKTESKVLKFLKKINIDHKHQFKPIWCKNKETNNYLRFDICIEDIKLIIEIDGEQHFTSNNKFNNYDEKKLQKQRNTDIYKMKCAEENGYHILRLYQPDVWNDKINWKKKIKKFIKNIKENKYVKPTIKCYPKEIYKYIFDSV